MASGSLTSEQAASLTEALGSLLEPSDDVRLARALRAAIAAGDLPYIDLEYIKRLLKNVCGMIPSLHKRQLPDQGKNTFGESVTDLDIKMQRYLAQELTKKYPGHVLVGEEDTPGACASMFPDPLHQDTDLWTIDPIDGSKILEGGSFNCSTVLGYQKGRLPIFGSSGRVSDRTYIVGGKYWPVTINGEPVYRPRAYNQDNIELAYGLGRRKPQEVRDSFEAYLNTVTSNDKLERPGHLSLSCTLLLQGKKDAYLSLKEEWYKFGPWYAIMTKAGFVSNIDPDTVNMNDAFSAWFATPEFAAKHLQPGSKLAKFMEN